MPSMTPIPSLPAAPAGLALDARSLDRLKSRAATDPQGAVRAAARQFEALFMNELMKSMRASTLASGMLDNEGSKLGTDMLDTQLSAQMTGLPGGLSETIARQLERQMGLGPGPLPATHPSHPTAAPAAPAAHAAGGGRLEFRAADGPAQGQQATGHAADPPGRFINTTLRPQRS